MHRRKNISNNENWILPRTAQNLGSWRLTEQHLGPQTNPKRCLNACHRDEVKLSLAYLLRNIQQRHPQYPKTKRVVAIVGFKRKGDDNRKIPTLAFDSGYHGCAELNVRMRCFTKTVEHWTKGPGTDIRLTQIREGSNVWGWEGPKETFGGGLAKRTGGGWMRLREFASSLLQAQTQGSPAHQSWTKRTKQ